MLEERAVCAMWKRRGPSPTPRQDRRSPSESESGTESAVTQFLTGDSRHDQRSIEELLDELAQISKRVAAVSGKEDLKALLTYVVDTSIARTRAGRGLLVIEQADGTLRPVVGRGKGKQNLGRAAVFSTSAVQEVLQTDAPRLDKFCPGANRDEVATSIHDLELRALMCVPFLVARPGKKGTQRGVLYVDSQKRTFSEHDLSYFTVLSQQIAIVLEIAGLHVDSLERLRLEQDLELASAIQRGFMSQIHEAPPSLDIYGWYKPAERASGDFYSFVRTRPGTIAVMVGDATGHGIGPALVAASAQGSLSSLLELVDDPAEALTRLNRGLAKQLDDGLFLSLCLVVLESDGMVRVLNAGHPSPLVWRKDGGQVQQIEGHGPALGIDPDFEYEESGTFHIDPGDAIVIYTDGLAEARALRDSTRLFGVDGVRSAVQEQVVHAASARELAEAIAGDALEFAGGVREDDMTVVAIRCRE